MKANELMIGDWIDFYHPYEPEKKIVTRHCVTEIFECGLIGISNHNNPVHADHIEPVKITPEILEKNGFRIIFESEWHVSYFQDIESFHTEVKVDKIGIYQKLSMLDGLGNRVTIVECKYVHQLQHALILCGIDKTIEL